VVGDVIAEKGADDGNSTSEFFNDVYEVNLQIPGQVIIGQWTDGSRLDVCIKGAYGWAQVTPGSVLRHLEKIVEEADNSCWIRCS